VVSIDEHLAAPPATSVAQRRIDIPRGRDLESLHAPRKRELVLGLDQQVHVRALDTDVHDPELLALRRREGRVADGLVHVSSSQIPDDGNDTEHDMQRLLRADLRALLMRRAGPRPDRLAPCALALPAASEQLLLDMPPPTTTSTTTA
jgi:hypothetical protein